MLLFVSFLFTTLLCCMVHATTWSSVNFAATNAGNITNGGRTFLFDAGSIQLIAPEGTPASPSNYNLFVAGFNFASTPTSITNVAPSSNYAAVGYTSPASNVIIVRGFYQASTGNIRSVWRSDLDHGTDTWHVDPTVIATGLPLGTPMSAFQQSDSAGNHVVVFQYTDANGLLTQRISNTDAGNWGDPVTVMT